MLLYSLKSRVALRFQVVVVARMTPPQKTLVVLDQRHLLTLRETTITSALPLEKPSFHELIVSRTNHARRIILALGVHLLW